MAADSEASLGRVALVHEWLQSRSGSEKTFEQMAEAFPEADLFALTENASVDFHFDRSVQTTALQRSQMLNNRRDLSLPLMPLAWKALRSRQYDVVVTSSHAFARFFPAPGAVHLSYVHTPLRYAWLPDIDGRGSSPLLGPARWALRAIDRRSVAKVKAFAANSNVVRERVERFYGRSATVIFPPVDVDFFRAAHDTPREEFVLGVSRWIPYKRLDLVIRAAELVGLPVVLAGGGPLRDELEEMARTASVPVRLMHDPTNEQLRHLYRTASALIFPAEEDFGIVPVEAQAAGTPVVALRAGGALDSVRDGITGVLVDAQTPHHFAAGIQEALGLPAADWTTHVEQFSAVSFRDSLRAWVLSEATR